MLRNATTSELAFHLVASAVRGQVPGDKLLIGSHASGIPECTRGIREIFLRAAQGGDAEFTPLGPGESIRCSLRLPEHVHRFNGRVEELALLTLPFFIMEPQRATQRAGRPRRVDITFGVVPLR